MIAFTCHFLCRCGAAASARLAARGGKAQPMRDSVAAPGLGCDGYRTRASPPQLQIFTTFSLRAGAAGRLRAGAAAGQLRARRAGGLRRRRRRARRAVPIARTSFFRSKAPPSDIEPNEMQPKSQFLLPLCDFGYISPGSPTKSIFSSIKMAPQARAHRRDAIEVTFRFNEVQP